MGPVRPILRTFPKTGRPVIRLALSALALLLTLAVVARPSNARAADAPAPTVEDLLRQMASLGPDDCGPPFLSESESADAEWLEGELFDAAKTLVAARLNAPSPAGISEAGSRAKAALREIEQSSAEIDKAWPAEARFHFEVLALSPGVLMSVSYRNKAQITLFGAYGLNAAQSTDPGIKWREVYLLDMDSRPSSIDLYPLHRGPGGRARLLARVWSSGCAGSIGESYYGYEWAPADGQVAGQIISIVGAQGLDESASVHVGKLSTRGRTIQLPYCFFSAVDTWDNPTLCAADSFDLSGDKTLFRGRIYNRPDLVTVARAIQYAQDHELDALRGYCASDAVARKLAGEVPPHLFADTLKTIRTGPGREAVIMVDGAVRFDLIKRRGGWLIEKVKISAEGP
jgi:hypothetical protein